MSTRMEKVILNRIGDNPNMLVPYYLMTSYAYYVEDDPIVSDSFYDNLAKKLLKEFDNIQHHHKSVIDKDALSAGSFLGEYPGIVQGALHSFKKMYQ